MPYILPLGLTLSIGAGQPPQVLIRDPAPPGADSKCWGGRNARGKLAGSSGKGLLQGSYGVRYRCVYVITLSALTNRDCALAQL
eukprot:4660200-Pyramimonas_sp.AAC.1